MKFSQFLIEKEKEKEKKIVFKETDGRSEFPRNTISAIEKQISAMAKDLELEWKSAAELVDSVLEELDIPKPQSYLKERWQQYVELLAYAVKQLYQARGMKSTWSQSI